METHYKNKTEFYDKGRMGYAEEALQLIAERISPIHAQIADMGAGTGLFSEALLNMGYVVYGVEPDTALLEKAVQHLAQFQSFRPVAALAENTGLPRHSLEAITAASAVHWFDSEAFLRECKRIVKPGGEVFILYNVRQSEDAFSQEQASICRRYCPRFVSFHHGADRTKTSCPMLFPKGYEEARYPYNLVYTKEQFLSRSLSSSYSPNPAQSDYAAYHQALKELIEKYAQNGYVTIRNHTVVWYGKIEG